jgi:hypothetical protein
MDAAAVGRTVATLVSDWLAFDAVCGWWCLEVRIYSLFSDAAANYRITTGSLSQTPPVGDESNVRFPFGRRGSGRR